MSAIHMEGGLISEGVFNLVPFQRDLRNYYCSTFKSKEKTREVVILHIGTKLKIFKIKASLIRLIFLPILCSKDGNFTTDDLVQ